MTTSDYIEQLFTTITKLSKLLESLSQDSCREKSTTAMQFFALKHIRHSHNSTVGDLAIRLKLSKSSATQLVERMEKLELIERLHDTTDRRLVRLSITSKGEQEQEYIARVFIRKVFSEVPDEDLRTLIRIHEALIRTLQKENKEGIPTHEPHNT